MQFSEEVKAERRQGVGGSEVAALFGLSPYKNLTKLSLYYDKRGELDRSVEESEAMFWGQILEEPIATVWAERNNCKIRRQPMRWMDKDRKAFPLFCSMDRQIYGHPRGPGLMEVKNFNAWRGKDIETLEDVPPYVRIQQMHGLAVTGYTWGVIAILVGGNTLKAFVVERDEEACQSIIAACQQFMQDVANGVTPNVDAKSGDILDEVYSKGGAGSLTCLDAQVQMVAKELREFKAKNKAMGEEWELRKNFIKLYMRDHEELIIPGVCEFTWKKSKDKTVREFNEDRFRRDHPALHEEYTEKRTVTGSRTFRDKDLTE